MLQRLLDAKADPNLTNNFGHIPLYYDAMLTKM